MNLALFCSDFVCIFVDILPCLVYNNVDNGSS